MALKPDVVVELAIPICPPANVVDDLAEQFGDLVLPDFGDASRKVLAVCGARPTLGVSVLTVGIWADGSGFTDAQRRTELSVSNLLVQGRSAGLFITSDAIQAVVTAAWAEVPKRIGRARLDEMIEINVLSDSTIRTKIKGTYKLRFLPNPDFTYTVTDRLSLKPAGSIPPLQAATVKYLDLDWLSSLILAAFEPFVTVVNFFGAGVGIDVPSYPSIGAALAGQWPAEILTPTTPPPLLGKIVFTWSELIGDQAGVRTLGAYAMARRRPRVSISGPTDVTIEEALGAKSVSYVAGFHDFNPASVTVQWGGATGGNGANKRVTFRRAGTQRLTVTVRDGDGGIATDEIIVTVSINPLKPGQQPL